MSLLKKIGLTVGVAALALGANYVMAFSTWTGPTAPPPGDNVDVPVNVGPTVQQKYGDLKIEDDDNESNLILTTETLSSLYGAFFGGPIQIKDGTEGLGKVLASDEDGDAGWANINDLIEGGSGSGGGSNVVLFNDPILLNLPNGTVNQTIDVASHLPSGVEAQGVIVRGFINDPTSTGNDFYVRAARVSSSDFFNIVKGTRFIGGGGGGDARSSDTNDAFVKLEGNQFKLQASAMAGNGERQVWLIGYVGPAAPVVTKGINVLQQPVLIVANGAGQGVQTTVDVTPHLPAGISADSVIIRAHAVDRSVASEGAHSFIDIAHPDESTFIRAVEGATFINPGGSPPQPGNTNDAYVKVKNNQFKYRLWGQFYEIHLVGYID